MGSVSAGVKSVAAAAATAAGVIGILAALVIRDRAVAAVPMQGRAAASGSLCTLGEVPLFTCSVGIRQVAVCGDRSGATYRYGRPGKIELTSKKVTLAKKAFSGGGETQITALNRTYSYTVFAKTVRTSFDEGGRNDPQSLSGLLVHQGGRTLSSKACRNDAPILARAGAVIPAGTFVPH